MIIIVCGGGIGFPNGSAPTGRVTAYARGLIEQGAGVLVLCIGTTEVPEVGILNTQVKGKAAGIDFEYASGTTIRGRTFLGRRWLPVRGAWVAALRIVALKRKEGVEAVLLFPDRFFSSFWFWLVTRLSGTPYLLERNEHPFYGAEQKGWRGLWAYSYLHTVYRLFDGVIVISDFLEKHMKQYMNRNARMVRIPILVNADDFSPTACGTSPLKPPYVAYCGFLNETKDGVMTLMKSFAMIQHEFPELTLALIGDSYVKSQVPLFRSFAEELGIKDRVVFTGTVARKDLPPYLCGATLLALARPSSLQADAGFPSKVGEYLATGKPVVLTRTGELHLYLEDGKSAYFVAPNDHVAFADRLRQALADPDEAEQVGRRGLEVAQKYFDYRSNGKRLFEFIQSLNNRGEIRRNQQS